MKLLERVSRRVLNFPLPFQMADVVYIALRPFEMGRKMKHSSGDERKKNSVNLVPLIGTS